MFSLIFDVRYNDDHTGQALLDHTNKYFDALRACMPRTPPALSEEIIKSTSPVGVGRTLLSIVPVPLHCKAP